MRCFWAIVKHKWFVLLASFRTKLPLWRVIMHDMSKFTIKELPHYDRQFFGDKGDPHGYAKAWLHHYHHNDHHWEHWIIESIHSSVSPNRDGCIVDNCLPMPRICVKEMITDWLGASKTKTGSWDMKKWLTENLPKMRLHPDTRWHVIDLLYDEIYGAN